MGVAYKQSIPVPSAAHTNSLAVTVLEKGQRLYFTLHLPEACNIPRYLGGVVSPLPSPKRLPNTVRSRCQNSHPALWIRAAVCMPSDTSGQILGRVDPGKRVQNLAYTVSTLMCSQRHRPSLGVVVWRTRNAMLAKCIGSPLCCGHDGIWLCRTRVRANGWFFESMDRIVLRCRFIGLRETMPYVNGRHLLEATELAANPQLLASAADFEAHVQLLLYWQMIGSMSCVGSCPKPDGS